jgi:hypothetical protein
MVLLQTSCSLQHVPIDTAREEKLDPALKAKLAFAIQKLGELGKLAKTPAGGAGGTPAPENKEPQIDPKLFNRSANYEARRPEQFKANPNASLYVILLAANAWMLSQLNFTESVAKCAHPSDLSHFYA